MDAELTPAELEFRRKCKLRREVNNYVSELNTLIAVLNFKLGENKLTTTGPEIKESDSEYAILSSLREGLIKTRLVLFEYQKTPRPKLEESGNHE
jgi:hypothetical protein